MLELYDKRDGLAARLAASDECDGFKLNRITWRDGRCLVEPAQQAKQLNSKGTELVRRVSISAKYAAQPHQLCKRHSKKLIKQWDH